MVGRAGCVSRMGGLASKRWRTRAWPPELKKKEPRFWRIAMKSKSGKVCKACPRCSKIMTSSALSKHLKQAHGEEIAREESAAAGSAAGYFARLVSKQAARPEKQQPEKQSTVVVV